MNNIYYLFTVNATFFTDFSILCKKKQKYDNFYGLAYAKSDLLNSPIYNHISYLPDLLTEQVFEVDYEYLKKIEEKYNITISDLIHADRHLMRFDKNKRLYYAEKLIKTFEDEITKYKISTVFSAGLSDFISYFASKYCKMNKINFFYIVYARLGTFVLLSDRLDTGPMGFEENFLNNYQNINEIKDLDKTKFFINEYINKQEQPGYVKSGGLLYKAFSLKDFQVLFQTFHAYYKDTQGFHYDRNPFMLPFYRMEKIIRKKQYKKMLNNNSITLGELNEKKYFIYPLHFHPEAATLIQGRWFNDQLRIIEIISKNLPVDYTLVVKEHKVSVGRRPISFYNDIVRFHNIEFVDDTTNVYDLLSASSGVVTISSSMGLEALMLRKPVITFGDIFYNKSKNVFLIKDYADVKGVLNKVIKHEFIINDLYILLHTLLAEVIEVGNFSPTNHTEEAVKNVYQKIEAITDND